MSEPYEVHDREFEAVSVLEGRQRFEHLLKRICDTETVFLLVDDDGGLIVLTDEENAAHRKSPWPHPRYTEAYRSSVGGGEGYDSVDLTEFVDEVLPHLAEDGAELAVMPTEQGSVVTITADELRNAIISYHDEWYGGWPK